MKIKVVIFILFTCFLLTENRVLADTLKFAFDRFPNNNSFFESDLPIGRFVRGAVGGFLTRVSNKEKKEVSFSLADIIEIAPSGKGLVIKVRKGARFFSGQQIREEDLRYSIGRCISDGTLPNITTKDVSVVHEPDNKLVLKLNAEYGALYDLTNCPIVDSVIAGIFGSIWGQGTNIISAGAYKIDSFSTGSQVTLARNDIFMGRMAKQESIKMMAIELNQQTLSAIQIGLVDLISTKDKNIILAANKDKTLVVDNCATLGTVIRRRSLNFSCSNGIDFHAIGYDF